MKLKLNLSGVQFVKGRPLKVMLKNMEIYGSVHGVEIETEKIWGILETKSSREWGSRVQKMWTEILWWVEFIELGVFKNVHVMCQQIC